MATSMAAALAASLPAAPAAPVPVAPTYEAIPASMSKVIDIEAEIPLTCVQLDGMVVTKILKHAREAPSSTAHGLLLGLDLDGTLEISNSFALPHHAGDEDDRSSKSTARYQASMLRSLKEVQSDDSVVGFYQATMLGAFFNQTLVDTQAIHQDKLRHGGIVIVHGKGQAFGEDVLTAHSLTFSTILEEVPLKIRTNPLLSAFVNTLTTGEGEGETAIGASFATLDYGTAGLTRNLEQIVEAVDHYRTEEGNLAYMSRQIARERAKADSYVAKRKEESAARVAQGLAPLPEEDVARLFKIPAEPSRLESMLLLGQIDAYGRSLAATAGTGLVKIRSLPVMFCKFIVLLLALAASVAALNTHRSTHNHRALAKRVVDPSVRRRADGKRCRPRPSSTGSDTPVVNVVATDSSSSSSTSQSAPTTSQPAPTTSQLPPPSPPAPTTQALAATKPKPNTGLSLPSFMTGTQIGQGTYYSSKSTPF
ncbi:hypothetical protein H0H81_007507 [Sphagnurus paluster]|uniref:Eukaryotic translation initiation factor 3 subunit H n=1 Tax=Sphagnurus paluster TaxID=117069 RepID=A0A9P7GT86_9AGAR|nr:hypothetical protein H0H81_007507 [Sphagnurus paluster]